jgi:predicted O-methyltransferase YrrM
LIPTLREKFDLILIDGDHSESGVYTDLQQSWELLSPGGIIVLDDLSHHAHPGIKKSFDRFRTETKGLKVVFEDLAFGMGIGVFEKKKRASRTAKKRSAKSEVERI